ncbi:unnamed protein product [Triticum turgidum subsp. durum]|uniref:Uncharacterized protein n=1 Tax=Triticum turgidum subsp. durum TaxID=4567 RepID=A0A9R1QXG6_TRITD|nr:unnamed protein product [Triticum turgidum subsp. durum]
MVKSAIVGEGVSWIFSSIAAASKTEEKPDLEATRCGGLERLEMARIKMEAALQTSNKWQITDTSLLDWRKKLKYASQDCNDAVRRCRQLSREEDEAEQVVRKSSFPRRFAHATKAFISSRVGRNNDGCSMGSATVQRFERLADGAGEFMRYVQLGSPRQHLFFDPLIGHIFAGKSLLYHVLDPGGQLHIFGIRSMSFEDRGLEAMVTFVYQDCKAPKNNFRLGFMLRVSESTDIIGTTIKCLRRVTPHFKSTAEIVINEITQLPTQDFFCVPQPQRLSTMFPEPVCQVYLQRQISVSEYNNLMMRSTTTSGNADTSTSVENFPPLKLGILFMPHHSLENPESTSEGSAIEAIDGEKQHLTHVNVHPDQLDEMLLPKAIDYLYHNTEVTNYQICWTSNHGSAHLYVENTRLAGPCIALKSTRRDIHNMFRQKQQDQQIKKVQLKQVARDYLKLWVVRSSERVRSLFSAWID